jgi:response regulator NasT
MAENEIERLRVLIANEPHHRLELLAQVVAGLGHEVIAREVDVKEAGAVTAREHPDVALVGLGLASEHALELIGEIVHEASCPVIALLAERDPAYVREAAKPGVFAYIVDTTPEELQSAIDITLQRFTEYHGLQRAFGRRTAIEQAKGILMARHVIDADTAFAMLRDHSQHNGRKLADVAATIIESHWLWCLRVRNRRTPENGRVERRRRSDRSRLPKQVVWKSSRVCAPHRHQAQVHLCRPAPALDSSRKKRASAPTLATIVIGAELLRAAEPLARAALRQRVG